jgi:uncharacterized protein YjbJ (UPF0337 family)
MGSGEDRMKGMADEAKGKAKQAWGDMTDDKETHAEGKRDEFKGEARQKMADVKDKAKDKIDDIG